MKKFRTLPGLPGGFDSRVGAMTANERRLGRYIRDGSGHPVSLGGLQTKEFTEAIEGQFTKLHKDVQDALKQANVAALLAEDIAQRYGEGGVGSPERPQTWGEQFTEAKAGEIAAANEQRGRVSMEIKTTLTTATTDAAGSVGDLAVPQRDQVLMMPKRRLTIRNLLDVRPASTGSVEYPQQVSQATGAGMVAEGASNVNRRANGDRDRRAIGDQGLMRAYAVAGWRRA